MNLSITETAMQSQFPYKLKGKIWINEKQKVYTNNYSYVDNHNNNYNYLIHSHEIVVYVICCHGQS